MQFINDLNEFSIDACNFDYKKYKNTEEENFYVSNINSGNAKYIITPEIDISRNALCKIYNPEILTVCQDEESRNKVHQPWYSQLQVLREAFLLREIEHPAIIKYIGLNLYNNKIHFDSDDDSDEEEEEESKCNPTLFLEYAGMRSIQEKITRTGRLNSLLFTPFKRQICIIGIAAAVRYLHRENIVHRNLCPGSIWLDENFYPKIFDFSHSREFKPEDGDHPTVTYNESNQSRYQAPEIYTKTIDYQFLNSLDIFSLGRLLYLLLTGYEPFSLEGDDYKNAGVFKLQDGISKGAIPKFPDTISQEWQDLLESCWSLNPSDRPNADFIYENVTDNDYLIADFEKEERMEIIKYFNLIKKYEENDRNTYQPSLEISTTGEFHADTFDMTREIYANFKELDHLLKNGIVEKNRKRFLVLINELVQNNQFYTEDYLPRVMKYADRFIDNNFINKAFGPKTKINKASKSIEALNISPETTKIPENAFKGFKKLKRVYIPNSVEIIDDEAFCGCEQLEYVYLPKSIKDEDLGEAVFKNCPKLNNITIPKDLIVIQESTFEGDVNLREIKLNNKLRTIRKKAFSNCLSLETIKIPESVTRIERNVFQSCKKLENIEFPGVSSRKIGFIKSGIKYSKSGRRK